MLAVITAQLHRKKKYISHCYKIATPRVVSVQELSQGTKNRLRIHVGEETTFCFCKKVPIPGVALLNEQEPRAEFLW